MEEKTAHNGQNSLFDQLKLMKTCPLCTKEYTKDSVKIVEESIGTQLMHLTCGHCKNAMLAIFVSSNLGMSSVGMLTDLTAYDAKRLHRKEPISEEAVLALHDSINKNQKEIIHLLTK